MTTFTNPHGRIEELLTRVDELEAIVRDAECLLTIVEPRSHKAEYLALLARARLALGMTARKTGAES